MPKRHITIKELVEQLALFPQDSVVGPYDAEVCGVAVNTPGENGKYLGFVKTLVEVGESLKPEFANE